MVKVIAIIPARGGSKGVPKKNIKLLGGRPLIHYTIFEAYCSKYIDKIYVSTDYCEIKRIVKQYNVKINIKIIDRPKKLSDDKTLIVPVLRHAVKKININEDYIIVLLQPTSPLRSYKDIDAVIEKMIKCKVDSAETFCEADNPANLFKIDGDNAVPLDKENLTKRRQDVPTVYRENGAVYCFKKSLLMKHNTMYGKKHKAIIMPKERSIDIDDELDFKIAEAMLK